MKTKEEIINGMCLTYRHDFGLLSQKEQDGIRNTMSQLYYHNVAPNMTLKITPEKQYVVYVEISEDSQGYVQKGCLASLKKDVNEAKVGDRDWAFAEAKKWFDLNAVEVKITQIFKWQPI